jgi:hypothetical protein
MWHWEVHLIPNPIRKVLSSMQTHRVRALLMGGQACVFYGAAEFSRDTDLAVLADAANLVRLRAALAELKAEPIEVPPCTLAFLKRGHGSHFRCHHPEAMRMRVDVMAKMRGVDPFASLWRRRTSIELPDGTPCDLLSLADLVQAKKTQRDKDWPMIRRLVEAHFFEHRRTPTAAQVRFWFRELRTTELLVELAARFPAACVRAARHRPLLTAVKAGVVSDIEAGLDAEQALERAEDRKYWLPLRAELERLRHRR